MVFKAPPPDILKMWTKRYPNLPLGLGPKFRGHPGRAPKFRSEILQLSFTELLFCCAETRGHVFVWK